MELPDKPAVLRHVTNVIAGFTRIPAQDIRPGWELKKAPLKFDDSGLRWLAMSLRGYVSRYNRSGTVRAPDTRKSKQTVTGLSDLCYSQIHA